MTDTTAASLLPRPLRALAGRALQAALNRAVDLDPETRKSLGALEGRRVQLHLRGPGLTLVVHVIDGQLKVEPPDDTDMPALQVSASPGSLLGMALRAGGDAVPPGKVDIAGDADLARRLEKLARGYAPDFEEAFARQFGDVLGVPLARALRKGLSHVRDSGRHFAEDSADWLREESRLVVSADELDDFLDDVDALREHTERVATRVDRLARRRESGA
ncbi:MAG TPA: SCP2 sterol-binding domain-containing protein [Oleiagrimonas sp.]|nr:SCP2 sterol-binding domain-containing protein [Oleiagrimonas sp.]